MIQLRACELRIIEYPVEDRRRDPQFPNIHEWIVTHATVPEELDQPPTFLALVIQVFKMVRLSLCPESEQNYARGAA